MAAMKDLRALLIDCRIELRKLARDFQKSELCERLDLAIQQASNASLPPAPEVAMQASDAPPSEKTQTVSQVALAWQTAARDLKFSDPALYTRDPARFAALTKAIDAARAEKDAAEERWLELAEQVEG